VKVEGRLFTCTTMRCKIIISVQKKKENFKSKEVNIKTFGCSQSYNEVTRQAGRQAQGLSSGRTSDKETVFLAVEISSIEFS
jgi:hypothetical protein